MTGSSTITPTPANPFVGPRPLAAGQQIFGRDLEIQQLYYLLSAERVVLLYSPSGAGKSSLLQAGLLPRMAERFDVWAPARVSLPPRPDAPPAINRFVRSCNLSFESGIPRDLQRPEEALSAMTLAEYVAGRPRRRSAPKNIVLLFDQFEETLTVDPSRLDAKREFFTQLGQLLSDQRIWAIFAIREDYLAALDPYAELLPNHLTARFRLDLLSRACAEEAIEKNAGSAGRTFDPSALQQLIGDLAAIKVQQPGGEFKSEIGPYIEPLQMQVVCRNLWEGIKPESLRIEAEDVARFGNVTSALSDYYDAEVAHAAGGDDRVERAMREWFDSQLIAPGGIRGQVVRGEGKSGGLANGLVEKLVDAHLVRGEQRLGATWYELAHDRLIQPVQQSNASWFQLHLSPLQKTAALWRVEHPEGLLFQGKDLDDARAWAAAHPEALVDTEREFLAASEKKQQEIDAKKRAARRLKQLTIAALVCMMLALGEAVNSWRQTIKANQALAESVAASVPATLTLENGQAAALANLAYALRKDPDSFEVRAWISSLLTQRSWWVPTPQMEYDLDDSPNYAVSSVAFTPDGRIFATGRFNGVQFWDVATGQKAGPFFDLGSDTRNPAVRQILFSPDGSRMLVQRTPYHSGGKDVEQVWDIRSHRLLGQFWTRDDEYSFTCTAFSPGGKRVFSSQAHRTFVDGKIATDNAFTTIWDAGTGSPIGQPIPNSQQVNSIDVSPDGRIALASDDGTARIWDGNTGKPIGPILDEHAPVKSARFSLDGKYLLLAAGDHAILRDAATGRPVGQPFAVIGPDYPVTRATFSPDSRTIVTDPGARFWSWSLEGGVKSVGDLQTGSGGLIDLGQLRSAFTADGSAIVTQSQANGLQTWDPATQKQSAQDLASPMLRVGNDLPSLLDDVFSPRGRNLFAGKEGRLIRIQHLDRIAENDEPLNPRGSIPLEVAAGGSGLRVASWIDGKIVVTGRAGNTIGKPVAMAKWPKQSFALLSPDGARLITVIPDPAGGPRAFALWDTSSGTRVGPGLPNADSADFSPFGPYFVLTDAHAVRAFDAQTGAPLGVFEPLDVGYEGEDRKRTDFPGQPIQTRFSPNGRTAITSYKSTMTSEDYSEIWDLHSGKHGDSILWDCEFALGGKSVLAVGNNDSKSAPSTELVLKDLAPGGLSEKQTTTPSQVSQKLSSLWAGLFHQPKPAWKSGLVFPGGLYKHAISHDGRFLLAVPVSNTVVQLRDIKTGSLAGPLIYPGVTIDDVHFSPDDKIILIETDRASSEGQKWALQLWSVATLKPISDWIPISGQDDEFAFSSGDTELYVLSAADKSVRAYPILLGAGSGNDNRLLADLAEAASGYHLDPRTHSPEPLLTEVQYKLIERLRNQYQVPANADFFQFLVRRLSQHSAP